MSQEPQQPWPESRDEEAIQLRERLQEGDTRALAELFERHRERLRKIARFRIDFRLTRRIDESDVLQETYLRASTRWQELVDKPTLSPFVWLRLVLQQQLADLHRHHLGARKRDVRRDQQLEFEGGAQTSLAIAAQLVASMTSPSQVLAKQEEIARIEQSLSTMPELDREIIALRHFEELSSAEAAEVLGIERNTASKRYVRAVQRLQQIMSQLNPSL